jgi:hypothetical protein
MTFFLFIAFCFVSESGPGISRWIIKSYTYIPTTIDISTLPAGIIIYKLLDKDGGDGENNYTGIGQWICFLQKRGKNQ